MAMLIHLLGGEAAGENENPDCYPLREEEHYIGRLPQSQICIQDDSISRLHARFYKKDGDWWIEDLRSRNGVFVNARSVNDTKLIEGDIITIGDLYFVLSYRRPDQIDQIRSWVEERVEDAMGYHRDVIRLKDQSPGAQRESSVISLPEEVEAIPDPPASPAPESPDLQPKIQPQTQPQDEDQPQAMPKLQLQPKPKSKPQAANKPQPQAIIKPQPQAVIKPQPQPKPVQPKPVQPSRPPGASPASKSHTPAPNVMGKDYTVLILCSVVGVLAVIALIWRFTDWFR